MQFDETTQKNVDHWLNGSFSQESKDELDAMIKASPQKVVDAFYTRMSFGTGGLRGVMGVGTNRMNEYTVAAATQGLAQYILSQKHESTPSVLIGHDSRHNSPFFAEIASRVFAYHGIRVYIYKDLRPVPLVSFGCRYKKCISAVMITASHNPPEYNGYKVYWEDGAQVLPPHDEAIIGEVNKVDKIDEVRMVDSMSHDLISYIHEEIDTAYLDKTSKLPLYPKVNQEKGAELKIVYTPIHGAGITMVPKILSRWGFSNVTLVKEQSIPDGSFPTVKKPNPEEKEALQLGLDLLLKTNSDILMGTDPDTDRIGVAVLHECKAILLSGNEVACIAANHIANALDKDKPGLAAPAMVKTIVTSELFKKIAESHSFKCFNVLTGFKYIGQLIRQWEQDHANTFLFGAEESYGYLFGTHARDKDAVIMAALLAEIALQAKLDGKTLVDVLHGIYKQHGIYREKLVSVVFPDTKETKEKLKTMMENLRSNPPKSFASQKVIKVEDYLTSTATSLDSGEEKPITLPKSNVLLFWLDDESKIVIRPSGTEPKVKIYSGCKAGFHSDMTQEIELLDKKNDALIDALKKLIQ